jgi:inosine-uridine nucleoside N-ribohydrolase
MRSIPLRHIFASVLCLGLVDSCAFCQATPASSKELLGSVAAQKIIIDTDIGGDIDDAFAVALALQSPEFEILGMASTSGDTTLRARLLSRLLQESGRSDIPVSVGVAKNPKPGAGVSQAPYADGGPTGQRYAGAVEFLLKQIRRHPGEITLIAIGPLTNIGTAIDQDATTFGQLKRVVIMGGSVYRGYDNARAAATEPSAEYNIMADVPAARKLFGSGVPLYVMPLDSTQIKLEEVRRARLLMSGTPLTDALTLLYYQWSGGSMRTPTLFDPVAVAYAMHPELCPTEPLRLRVDEKGYTRVDSGGPNCEVCLHSDPEKLLDFFMARLAAPLRRHDTP